MMPWPNLTPQELAAYQQLLGQQNPQMGAAGAMNPQMMQAYQAMMAMQQPGMAQAQQQPMPSMANMLAARPTGGINPLPTTGAGFNPYGAGSNMSTILNNPQLMRLLMAQQGMGGAT